MLNALRQKLNSGMGRDVVWTFSVQILIMLCAFAINKLLANRLSIDDFGQYNVIKRSVQVLSFLMLAGVGIALPRYIPIYRNGQERRPVMPLIEASLIYIIGVTLVVCAVCWLFSSRLQQLILGVADNAQLLVIALAYAFALAMAQVAFAYYRGIGDFRWYNGTQLAVQLAIILPLIFLPVLSATSVFASWLAITSLLVAFYFGRELWLHRGVARGSMPAVTAELKTIVKYSSGRLVADFFQFTLAAFPLIYISNTMGLQPTAYYSVGITFVTMITPLFSFMGIILLPYVAECIAKHELAAANRLIGRLALFYTAASIAAITLLLIATDLLTRLLFAESYIAASDVTRIMVLAILPQALFMLYRNPIDAVSVAPYNLILLGISLAAMIFAFSLCTTLIQFAWAYVAVNVIQGLLFFATWQILKVRRS